MKRIKGVLSALLVLAFLLGVCPPGMIPTASAAISYSDVSGHWAAGSINRFNRLGFLDPELFPGSRFNPNRFITRIEFFSLLVRSLGATSLADISGFGDVSDLSANMHDIIAIANQMGIAFGNTDGTMRPHSNLLRQDAATLAARAMGMSSHSEWTLSRFNDGSFISPYARTYVSSFVEKGLMIGYPDGTFRPSAFITRAEAVRILDNLFPNVYQPEIGFRNVYLQGGLLIQTPGAEMRDSVIDGDVIIGDGVGNGNVVIANCTINGRLVVRGGGPYTVTVSNTIVSQGLYVASFGAETHIAVTDNSTVPIVESVSSFILSGSGVSELTILENARRNAVVDLSGVTLDDLNINGPGAQVRLNSGHAINVRFGEAGQGANLDLAPNTSVGFLTISAPNVTVSGTGTIRNLMINNSGAIVSQAPDLMTLGLNINALVAGQPIASVESQWSNNNIDRVSANSQLKVQLLPNSSVLSPFDQSVLHLSMVAGATSSEAHVTQSAASRIPLTQRNQRWGYWVGFFVPAPPDAGSRATLTYTYVDGAPITLPPKSLDTYSGKHGLLIYLPIFREPGREAGLIKEILHVNWGGHLTENIHFMSSTMHLAPLNAPQRDSLQSDFDNRIMHSIQTGATPYSGAEATRRILNSDNPLGLPSTANRGLDAINRAVSAAEARSILEDPEFARDLTVDTSGNSQYSALSNAGKQYVAEQVLEARKTAYATPSAVKAAFDRAVQARLAAETALLGQINSSADYSALRRIIEIATNAAILEFQTGADPYKSYTNAQKDAMAEYLWRLRQYRSIQEVIDAIKRYLGDPSNAPGGGGDTDDIRDMQIQRIAANVTPSGTTLAFGQTRSISVSVELTDGRFLTAAQIGSLIDQKVLTLKWDSNELGELQGIVGPLERTGLNTYRLTCTNRGTNAQSRSDRLTFALTDANNRRHTAVLSFTAQLYVPATSISRVIPEQVTMFVNGPPIQLEAVLVPTTATETAKWFSSNTSIARVDESTGIVTAVSPGNTVITARIEAGDTKTVLVRVYRNADDVVVDPNRVILIPGGSSVVTAYTATPGRQVVWSLTDIGREYLTIAQSGNSVTITARRNVEWPDGADRINIDEAVTARVVGSTLSTAVSVEIRRDTGIVARLSRGSIMYSGDPQLNYILTTVDDDAMMSQMLYVQVEQIEPDGIAPAARFIGGDRTPVRVGDPIGIEASNTGIGKVRIMLTTDPDGRGDLVAELFVIVAPRSESVIFRHSGTSGTWYPGTTSFGEGQRIPPGDIEPDATYGRVLTMQIDDRPTVTPRNIANQTLTGLSWSTYISNQHREILYQVRTDGSPQGVILDKNGKQVANPDPGNGFGDPYLLFDRVFVWDGGPYGGTPPRGYEFHEPSSPTSTSRLGFFKNETPEPVFPSEVPSRAVPRAVRLAILRGGSVDRVTTQMLTSTNGNLIPNNTQPTGLSAVVTAPPRNPMLAADARVWGDLFYLDTVDLFSNVEGVSRFNPVISPQSGFILWERAGGVWVKSTYDIYSVTEQEVRSGQYRITDVNGTEDDSENGLWGRVTAILIGDPNMESNSFYVRLLPNPINRPDAKIEETIQWRDPFDPVYNSEFYVNDNIIIRPGSRDAYDYRSPYDSSNRPLDYPYMGAEYLTSGDQNPSSMSVTSLDGISYFLFIRTRYPDAPFTVTRTFTYRYSVFQWSKLGFAPLPGSVGLDEGRQLPVQSMSYTPQVTTPLEYILTMLPQTQATSTVFKDTPVILWTNAAVQRALGSANITETEFRAPTTLFVFSPNENVNFSSTDRIVTFSPTFETQYKLTITAGTKVATVIFNVVIPPDSSVGGASLPITPGSASIVGTSVPATELPGIMAAVANIGIAPTNTVVESTDETMLSIDSSGVATPHKPGRVNIVVSERIGTRMPIVPVDILSEEAIAAPPSQTPPGQTPPGQTPPGQTPPGQTPPGQTPPVQTPQPTVLTAVSLRTTATIAVGKTLRLEPYVTPYNVDRSTLRWSSSDTTIATVSVGGIVSGVKEGSVKITVSNTSGSIKAECTVSVRTDAIPVTAIALSKTELTVNAGATVILAVTYAPNNATIRGVTWVSNSSAIARVEPDGKIIGVSSGTATITAISDSGARLASCTVTVRVPVTSIMLPEQRISLKAGETYQLEPIILPSNATDKNVIYTSRATSVATVSATGLITAHRTGSATIIVQIDAIAIACVVTVTT